jgi:hypothetical protein
VDWLCGNGEVYHRSCSSWTKQLATALCERCGAAIPESILGIAREQAAERDRLIQQREMKRKTSAVMNQLAELRAKTDAVLRGSSERS